MWIRTLGLVDFISFIFSHKYVTAMHKKKYSLYSSHVILLMLLIIIVLLTTHQYYYILCYYLRYLMSNAVAARYVTANVTANNVTANVTANLIAQYATA